MKLTSTHYKATAEVLLLIPSILLLILGIGETISGDSSGLQHFIELIPFLVIGFLGWHHPKIAGAILAITAVFLATLYFLLFTNISPLIRTIGGLVLFLPPVVVGTLFFTSNLESRDGEGG